MGIGEGMLFSVGAAFLFYRSWYAIGLALVLVPIFYRRSKKNFIRKRKKQLSLQFIRAMHSVSGALMAGYSMENAWKNARKDLEKLYGGGDAMCIRMKNMEYRMDMNEAFDPMLVSFAEETQVEDICNFAEIFLYAKRSGGNLAEIIKHTVTRMQEKNEVLEEIENAVTAQRTQQRVMNLMMPGILFFITVSSPEYADSLYHNPLGIAVMSACLAGYLCSCFWSEHITDIQV